jgi:hypothetical protein
MRIAVVGGGSTGLCAARLLGEDPRHLTTVFETGERFGGPRVDGRAVDRVSRLGVILRPRAQVERLAVDATGADLWINGRPERFELALVTTAPTETGALLIRSGLWGAAPVRKRVYFADDDLRDALARMASDHPGLRARSLTAPRESPLAHAVRALTHGTAGPVDLLDLSGELWPLDVPAVYVATHRWVLDVAAGRLGVQTTAGSVAELEAGVSLGFVGADVAAAVAALAVNAPIVPLAASAPSPRVVIGERFYPETSSIEALLDDMRAVLRHLEGLATETATPGHSFRS